VTQKVIALFISRFEILKTIGNSTHNFYKKCDTNKEKKQRLIPDKDFGRVVIGKTPKTRVNTVFFSILPLTQCVP